MSTGKERWRAVTRSGQELETQFNGVTEKLGVSAPSMEVVYFNAPGEREGEGGSMSERERGREGDRNKEVVYFNR